MYEVGKVWDPVAFRSYLRGVDLSWAKGVTLHHTAAPSLEQRPRGFTIQHLCNLQHHYQVKLGWSAGPHLFVDDDQIFALSPMDEPGTHARSFNRSHIGIEVLGNYDHEDPKSGRGLDCWKTAAAATKALLEKIPGGDFNFHRDDPKTSKTCPGKLVEREWVEGLIGMAQQPDDRESEPTSGDEIRDRLQSIAWQCERIRRLLP